MHKLLGYCRRWVRIQLAFERFGLSLLDTWIHVKLPWLPCKQNRDRVVCKIKDVPKRSFRKGTKSQTSLEWKGDHNREKWKLWVPIKIFLNLSIFPEKWDVQRNICADGSSIIITTMAEQLKPMNHLIHIFQTEINNLSKERLKGWYKGWENLHIDLYFVV
jgi:hypothetical protein